MKLAFILMFTYYSCLAVNYEKYTYTEHYITPEKELYEKYTIKKSEGKLDEFFTELLGRKTFRKYENFSVLKNGVLLVQNVKDKFGFIKGNKTIEPKFDNIKLAGDYFLVEYNDHIFWLDFDGNDFLNNITNDSYYFSRYPDVTEVPIFPFYTSDKGERYRKWKFYNKNGKRISKTDYDDVNSFRNLRNLVKRNNLYGFINENGVEVIKCQYKYAESFNGGYSIIKKEDQLYYVIDRSGQIVNELGFAELKNLGYGIFYGFFPNNDHVFYSTNGEFDNNENEIFLGNFKFNEEDKKKHGSYGYYSYESFLDTTINLTSDIGLFEFEMNRDYETLKLLQRSEILYGDSSLKIILNNENLLFDFMGNTFKSKKSDNVLNELKENSEISAYFENNTFGLLINNSSYHLNPYTKMFVKTELDKKMIFTKTYDVVYDQEIYEILHNSKQVLNGNSKKVELIELKNEKYKLIKTDNAFIPIMENINIEVYNSYLMLDNHIILKNDSCNNIIYQNKLYKCKDSLQVIDENIYYLKNIKSGLSTFVTKDTILNQIKITKETDQFISLMSGNKYNYYLKKKKHLLNDKIWFDSINYIRYYMSYYLCNSNGKYFVYDFQFDEVLYNHIKHDTNQNQLTITDSNSVKVIKEKSSSEYQFLSKYGNFNNIRSIKSSQYKYIKSALDSLPKNFKLVYSSNNTSFNIFDVSKKDVFEFASKDIIYDTNFDRLMLVEDKLSYRKINKVNILLSKGKLIETSRLYLWHEHNFDDRFLDKVLPNLGYEIDNGDIQISQQTSSNEKIDLEEEEFFDFDDGTSIGLYKLEIKGYDVKKYVSMIVFTDNFALKRSSLVLLSKINADEDYIDELIEFNEDLIDDNENKGFKNILNMVLTLDKLK